MPTSYVGCTPYCTTVAVFVPVLDMTCLLVSRVAFVCTVLKAFGADQTIKVASPALCVTSSDVALIAHSAPVIPVARVVNVNQLHPYG